MKKKPIEVFEEYLDKKAVTTVEENNSRELEEILKLFPSHLSGTVTETVIKVLVEKGLVTAKDFKRVLDK